MIAVVGNAFIKIFYCSMHTKDLLLLYAYTEDLLLLYAYTEDLLLLYAYTEDLLLLYAYTADSYSTECQLFSLCS